MEQAQAQPYPFASLDAAMVKRGQGLAIEPPVRAFSRLLGTRAGEDIRFFAGAWAGAFVFFFVFLG